MILSLQAEKKFRIGRQALWRADSGRWYVSIRNRTYQSMCEIHASKASEWRRRLT